MIHKHCPNDVNAAKAALCGENATHYQGTFNNDDVTCPHCERIMTTMTLDAIALRVSAGMSIVPIGARKHERR